MVSLDAVVQDGDHHIPASVAPLLGCQDVHLWAAAVVFISAVLMRRTEDKHKVNRYDRSVDTQLDNALLNVPLSFLSFIRLKGDPSCVKSTSAHHTVRQRSHLYLTASVCLSLSLRTLWDQVGPLKLRQCDKEGSWSGPSVNRNLHQCFLSPWGPLGFSPWYTF